MFWFFWGCHVLCIRFFIFCLIVCLLSETVQHESQVGKARRRKVWNIDILLTMLSLDMRLKKTHFSQAHWGLSSLQDKSLGSRESHPRDTLTAGEDLQTKVSTNVDLLSILWQNISWQSRTEEQLPVYQPPKKEEVVYSWEDFYPNKSVEVNFVLRQTAFINFFSQKCEECESSFFWRDFYHGCEVSSVGMRWLSGIVEICKNVSFFVLIIFLHRRVLLWQPTGRPNSWQRS